MRVVFRFLRYRFTQASGNNAKDTDEMIIRPTENNDKEYIRVDKKILKFIWQGGEVQIRGAGGCGTSNWCFAHTVLVESPYESAAISFGRMLRPVSLHASIILIK